MAREKARRQKRKEKEELERQERLEREETLRRRDERMKNEPPLTPEEIEERDKQVDDILELLKSPNKGPRSF